MKKKGATMIYPRMRRNKFLVKLLESSRQMWNDDIKPLTLSQIEWRQENKYDVIGCIGKRTLFKTVPVFLLRKDKNDYVLFAPASKRDDVPCFLYNIIDIDEFINRYPMMTLVLEDDDLFDVMALHDELEKIKVKLTRGFIETRENEETRIYELV